MKQMSMKRRIHPAALDAASDLRKGKVNRREFLRFATLLGVSVPAAYALAGCAPEQASAPMAGQAGADTAAAAGAIQRGGTWTSAMQLQLLDHPARLSWIQGANVVRQVSEYLTETGAGQHHAALSAGQLGGQRRRYRVDAQPASRASPSTMATR